MKCKSCGAVLDLTKSGCPACGARVELGRLTGILGVVCRACDAYNEPEARTCVACAKPLREEPEPTPPTPPPGSPVVRSFPKPAAGAPTRFVPSVLRPSADMKPLAPAPVVRPAIPPARPAPPPSRGPILLVASCPRCGAASGEGRFCAQCGQTLGARGTQVTMPAPPGRSATQASGPLARGRARLVLEGGDALEAATFRLDAESVAAGSRGAVRFPGDPCLAPHHATFFYRDGALHVRDEGARGGTYLKLRGLSVPLRAGDHFAVGGRLLRYAGQLPPAPTPPPDGTRRHGAPRPPQPALVVEEWLEGGASGRVFVRPGPSVTIGRAGCTVDLGDDAQISQAHAELVLDHDGTARLRDLGSSNGTFVRIPPHAERELRDGDFIRMGREVLRVALAE